MSWVLVYHSNKYFNTKPKETMRQSKSGHFTLNSWIFIYLLCRSILLSKSEEINTV